jgi:response regulator RpfG family c-di-GMP phosphodiesterase
MLKRILCVDDEPNVLQAFERQLRRQFELKTALGPELGLRALAEDGPFAVVVSDLRMPGMNGIEFLARVRQTAPDTVRVMLTGDADLGATIKAVNEGKIFQFLNKPCPADMFARTLESALEQYRLITAERELLESTLRGSIGVLSEILSLVNPSAFSRGHRIRRYVQQMAEKLNLPDRWQYELAAMLSQIGCVTVPPDVLEKSYGGRTLNAEEQQILSSQSQIGHSLLAKIPRLENVARMVADQRDGWNEKNTSPDLVKIGAHLLRVTLDFDDFMIKGGSLDTVLARMRSRKEYNPEFVSALEQVHVEEATRETRMVKVWQMKTSMIINASVFSKSGLLLLAKGQEVTSSAIARLDSFARTIGVVEPINVIVCGTKQPMPSADELTGLAAAVLREPALGDSEPVVS